MFGGKTYDGVLPSSEPAKDVAVLFQSQSSASRATTGEEGIARINLVDDMGLDFFASDDPVSIDIQSLDVALDVRRSYRPSEFLPPYAAPNGEIIAYAAPHVELTPTLKLEASSDDEQRVVLRAGDRRMRSFRITNNGSGYAETITVQLRTEPDLPDGVSVRWEPAEIALLLPQESRDVSIIMESDLTIPTLSCRVDLVARTARGFDSNLVSMAVDTVKQPKPDLTIFDDIIVNGVPASPETQLRRGKPNRIRFTVRNSGDGAAADVVISAYLGRNPAEEPLFADAESHPTLNPLTDDNGVRFSTLPSIQPNRREAIEFYIFLPNEYPDDSLRLTIHVQESLGLHGDTRELALAVEPPPPLLVLSHEIIGGLVSDADGSQSARLGRSVILNVAVANGGGDIAENVSVSFESDQPGVTLTHDSAPIGRLGVGGSQTIRVEAIAGVDFNDSTIVIAAQARASNVEQIASRLFEIPVKRPMPESIQLTLVSKKVVEGTAITEVTLDAGRANGVDAGMRFRVFYIVTLGAGALKVNVANIRIQRDGLGLDSAIGVVEESLNEDIEPQPTHQAELIRPVDGEGQ